MTKPAYMPKDLRRRAEQVRALVAARFPKAIMPKGDHRKRPLKQGIRHDLELAMPELTSSEIRLMLNDYCSGSSYLVQIQPGARRIDLQGNEVGDPIGDDEVAKAKGQLLQKHHRGLLRSFRDAVALAMPILQDDRDSCVECHTLRDDAGQPRMDTLEPEARAYIEAYDAALTRLRACLDDLGRYM